MYKGTVTSVRAIGGDIGAFPSIVGLSHGLVLSPYLFVLVMDERTRQVEDEILWWMLLTDNTI